MYNYYVKYGLVWCDMTIVHINEIELEKFLANFENKSEIVRQAVIEYQQRHYKGVYFNIEEAKQDLEKYTKLLEESKEKIENINKILKENENEQ